MKQSDFDKQFSEIQSALKAVNISYDFKNNSDFWESIGTLPPDKSFTKLAELYLESDGSQRQVLYKFCGQKPAILENLWRFIRRIGTLIQSKDDKGWLEVGLASALLDGGRADSRDLIASLAVLRFIAERREIDIYSVLDTFIQSAAGNIKNILEDVRDCPETNLHLTVQAFAHPEWVAESVRIFGVCDMQTFVTAMREQTEKESQARKERYPLNIMGITGKSHNQFVFNKNANEQTIKQLVEQIPPQMTVTFYDKRYPSPSDPGAYVTFKRNGAQYAMNRGNHGWSSRWEVTSIERLVRYFLQCLEYNMGMESFEEMSYFQTPPPRQKKWWEFWK